MALSTSVWTAFLYINICCFISDFCSVVNFNYVSSPKFVPNQKDFTISATSVSRFWSCQSFRSFSTLPGDGQTRLQALWKQIQNRSCRQVIYAKVIIFATLSTLWCTFASPFWNTCINTTSRRPIESRTAPFATVAVIAWMVNYMTLFSMSCTIYSNVMVAGTRYRIHLYTNSLIHYHAALCWR